jgi:AcrR family transcriptional regulator
MKEIVEKTGLSKGAFYHYFKSKEQVFEEIINHFYAELIITDYSEFSQDSLIQFYNDYLKARNIQISLSCIVSNTEEKVSTTNYFTLISDAMKMLPAFKRRYIEQQKMN